jgi:predicted ATPase/DNA-binding SARP family transcriptional activator
MMLRVSLFGGFRAWQDETRLTGFYSQKTQLLLAYLMLFRERAHPRALLANLFWGEYEDARAQAYLRNALYSLRKNLEQNGDAPYILSEGTSVRFNAKARYYLDVEEFENALAQAHQNASDHVACLQRAVALYQGDLLAGSYDDWILIEQEHLKEEYFQALQKLIADSVRNRQYTQALEWSTRAQLVRPLNEEVHRTLMRSHFSIGDRAAALKQYEACVALLQRELKVEPEPQTRRLYEEISQGKMAVPDHVESAVPRRDNLPQQLTRFIGRKREIAEVQRLLGTTRLLTLTGIGGAGKTRLALQAAQELLDEYADGVWLADFAPLTNSAFVASTVANALGVPQLANRSVIETLTDFLATKHLLLVLDNCEHVVESGAPLAEKLLQRCPRLQILATSREALNLAGEVVWKVPPLWLPDLEGFFPGQPNLITALTQYEAIALFCDRAELYLPEFRMSEENALVIARICRKLDGIPLAIELAAARVKMLSLDEIEERLSDSLQLLTEGGRTALPHHQTLRATFDWSYALLSDKERSLLRRLSVFAGGFSLWAVEGICGGKAKGSGSLPVDEFEVLDLLTRLVDKSLVSVTHRKGQHRYGLLEVVRQYGEAKLTESRETESMKDRHLDLILGLAERAEPELLGPQQASWLTRLTDELENLRAALEWAWEKQTEEGLRLVKALSSFWHIRGHWTEGRAHLQKAVARSAGASAYLQSVLLNRAGIFAQEQGDYEQASKLYEECLRYQRESEDKRGISSTLKNLGSLALYRGDSARAQSLFEESLAISRELQDAAGIAYALHNLGSLAWTRGNYSQAASLFEESLKLKRELGDKRGIAGTLTNLGLVAQVQGHYGRARALYEESVALQRELGNKKGMTSALLNLGLIAGTQGEYAQASALFEESLRLQRELGDRAGMALSLANLAKVKTLERDYADAHRLHEESLALYRALGDRRGIAQAYTYLGDIAQFQTDYVAALSWYEQSLKIHREMGDKAGIAYANQSVGTTLVYQGEAQAAQTYLSESLTILRELGDKRGLARSLHQLGLAALLQEGFEKSHALLAESLETGRQRGEKLEIAQGLESFARLAATQKFYERAVSLFGAAEALRESIHAPLPPCDQVAYARLLEAARASLGETGFTAAGERGRAMRLEQAIECALSPQPEQTRESASTDRPQS